MHELLINFIRHFIRTVMETDMNSVDAQKRLSLSDTPKKSKIYILVFGDCKMKLMEIIGTIKMSKRLRKLELTTKTLYCVINP